MNSNTIGILIAILSTFLNSLADITIKWVSLTHTPHYSSLYFQVTFILWLLVSIIGFSFLGKKLFIFHAPFYIILLRGTLTFISVSITFYVLHILPLDIFYSVIFLGPSIAAIMAIFLLGEKLNLLKILALAMGLTGILIITNPFADSFNILFIIPVLLTIIRAISGATTGIITRKYLRSENIISLAFYIFLICSVFGFIASVSITSLSQTVSIDYSILPFMVAIAVFNLGGIFAFVKAYQSTSIQLVAPTDYSFIVWGIVFGYIVFNHSPAISTLLGASIIIASNIITLINSKKS